MTKTERMAHELAKAKDRHSAILGVLGYMPHPIYPHFDECEKLVGDAWAEIRELYRQRDGLAGIWPGRAQRFEMECRELVMGVVARLKEALEGDGGC